MLYLDAPVSDLKGVGKKTQELLQSAGVFTLRDLMHYFPRGYDQYPGVCGPDDCVPDRMNALYIRVAKAPSVNPKSKAKTAYLEAAGLTRKIRIIWFHMPYIRSVVRAGQTYVFYGKIIEKDGILYLEQPQIFTPEEYQSLEHSIQPVYPLTKGLKNSMLRKYEHLLLDLLDLELEYLPEEIRTRNQLCEYNYALKKIHFPDSMEESFTARRRFAFDEFFFFLLQMQLSKDDRLMAENHFSLKDDSFVDDIIAGLPYRLTKAQSRTLSEVRAGMRGSTVMQRLIQGDVGSGKTIIAFLAMAEMSHNGYQSVMMAPTDVLARQHYQKLCDFVKMAGINAPVVLLTGSLRTAERREALKIIAEAKNALIVGTHALIQEGVEFCEPGIVITDEQHRFGVRQREFLSEKGHDPHILVMSATPIPRTLAIILYGDLEISLIDEVPATRFPIKNCVVNTSWRPTAYKFISREIENGHQVYVVCPLVEESELMEAENVQDYTEKLREAFQGRYQITSLHGRMKPEEKNRVMEDFLANKIQILVSTTVIEVGVDVPNATVMMVENAERFGLAQLHQLRGRVGRGDAQSYCIFIQGGNSKQITPRLEILNESNDGFYIAQQDLQLRGPGEFFGVRQSGDFSFGVADIYADSDLLTNAAYEVGLIMDEDPKLEDESHQKLKYHLEHEMPRFNTDLNL